LEQLKSPGAGPIGGIGYKIAQNTLLAVNMSDGSLETWNFESKTLVSDYKLNIASIQGLSFNDAETLLIGATKHEIGNYAAEELLEDYVDGIKVWDTATGKLAFCVTLCSEKAQINRSPDYIGAGIAPYGSRVFEFDKIGLGIDNIKTNKSSIVLLSDPDWYWHYIGRVVFNSTGNRYAVAYQEGAVKVYRIGILGIFSPEMGKNVDKNYKSISALTFSPNDKWLARIRDGKVTVWKVSETNGTLQYESTFPNAQLLAFDRSEQLLFVGTNDAISVIDLAEKSTLTTISTAGLTTFTISSDNRLLIWGDSKGAIHIWGIP
jgi:WD40 repeat protein